MYGSVGYDMTRPKYAEKHGYLHNDPTAATAYVTCFSGYLSILQVVAGSDGNLWRRFR